MSDLLRSEPSTEPRGLRLPYGLPGPANTAPDQFGRLRSQLVTTAVVAGCVIVLLAAAGFGSMSAGWYPTTDVAYGLAVGTVVVGIAATLRVYFLVRSLEQVPSPVHVPMPPPPRETFVPPEPVPAARVEQRSPPVELLSPVRTEGIQQWGDVFGKLSGRLQSLVNRLIRSIDKMEHELEDPELLDMLWSIDHLATLVRRQAENIAVLGGETLERRSDNPVDVNAVLRSAVAEIQRYRQVVTIPIRDARIHGHVVAEIIHLLSELLDNATSFSSDEAPKVAFRAQYVTAGLAIQVQDRGIGMDFEDLRRTNHLLDRDTRLDVGELFKDGRIGLAVVKELARRHNIGVELQPNIYGGIDASIVVPHKLLDARPADGIVARRPKPAPRETTSSQPVPVPARAAVAPPPVQQPVPQRAPQPAPLAAPQLAPKPPEPASQPVTSAQVAAPQRQPSFGAHDGADAPEPAPRPEPDTARGEPSGLPVRERGTAFAAVRAGQAVDFDGAPPRERPALPQRREQPSHLRPELRGAPVLARPIPGHSPNLLADVQLGRVAGQQEIAQEEAKSPPPNDAGEQPHHSNERNSEGENGTWPTT
jgi:anti-sigma regulatory factor (Ser/Thr protein kinase)